MTTPQDHLQQKLPTLIKLWREQVHIPGPPTQLRGTEATRIAQQLQKLSQGLTRDRKLAGQNYFKDPYQFGAYLFFYWPVSYAQAQFVLKKIPTPVRTVLEIGAGAAPLSIAALESETKIAVALDRSQLALKLAKQIAQHQKKTLETQLWQGNAFGLSPNKRFDLISFQHVLNELWLNDSTREEKIVTLILAAAKTHLTPQGKLLIMEPALTETSRVLLRLRNTLTSAGFAITAPCMIQSPCPALHKPTDSCHVDWPWSPPALIKNLAKQSGFKKNDLKMTYLVLQQSPASPRNVDQDTFLIVSEPMISKNKRIRFIGCGPQGRIGLALHPKNQTPANQLFFTLKRGDRIRIMNYHPQENGIKLDQNSTIQRLA